MKKLLAAAVFGLLVAGPASAQAVGGKYTVEGTNLDGSRYKGTAEIVLTGPTTCTIRWQTGTTPQEGICSRNDKAFAAAYAIGDAIGLVVYKINDDGSMEGVWTISGKEGNGTEKLTPAQ